MQMWAKHLNNLSFSGSSNPLGLCQEFPALHPALSAPCAGGAGRGLSLISVNYS